MAKNTGNSTTSTRPKRPGAVISQPKRRAARSTRVIGAIDAVRCRGGSSTRPTLRPLLLQASLDRQLVELVGGQVERLLGVLLAGHREVELAAERLDELHGVDEGRELLRGGDEDLELPHLRP